MSHTALIALVAGFAALALLLAVALAGAGRRAARRERARLAELAERLEGRIDEFSRELADAMGQAEEERRSRPVLDEIVESVDLDEVLERTLDGARELLGADAALLSLEAREGPPILSASGFPADSVELPLFVPKGDRDGEQHRSIELRFRYAGDTAEERLVRSGVGVPLVDAGGRLGHLTVYSCDAFRQFGEDEVERLEQLARRAAPAIENARRFREARQLADLDALTGMHNRRYFHQALEREVARARRYARSLALILIDLDDFKTVNDRVGHLGGDEVLAVAAERIRRVVRNSDIACRIGGDEFAVILPESGLDDAQLLFARMEEAIAEGPVGRADRLGVSGGIAELQTPDSPTDFFDAADEALYRAKQGGKARATAR